MVLDRLKTYYNLQTDSKLAELLGVQPNTLSMQRSRGTLPIEKIVERCSNVNMNWLLNKNADDQLPVHTLDESISYEASESLRVQALQKRVHTLENQLKSRRSSNDPGSAS